MHDVIAALHNRLMTRDKRVYKAGFIAMEPSVRALQSEIDPDLGADHIKIIKKGSHGENTTSIQARCVFIAQSYVVAFAAC